MKKILCLLLLLVLSAPAISGTDDSGLQVIQFQAKDMLGFATENITEDSVFAYATTTSNSAVNCHSSSTSLNSLSTQTFSLSHTTSSVQLMDAVLPPNRNFGAIFLMKKGTDYFLRVKDGANDFELMPHASVSNTYLFASSIYLSGQYIYVCNGDEVWKYVSGSGTSTRINSLPFDTMTCVSAATWKGRLFVATEYTMYNSAPNDYENWDVTLGAGETRFSNYGSIRKLIETQYGLYIFTMTGVFLLSGGDTTATWRIDKVCAVVPEVDYSNVAASAFAHKNAVLFSNRGSIYMIEGMNTSFLAHTPTYGLTTYFQIYKMMMSQDRYLYIAGIASATYKVFVFDIQTKSFYEHDWLDIPYGDNFYGESDGTKVLFSWLPTMSFKDNTTATTFEDFTYRTSYTTLDVNNGTHKRISRVEVDMKAATADTIECRLYYQEIAGETYETTNMVGAGYLKTYVWNVGLDQPVRKMSLYLSNDGQTPKGITSVKTMRVYYSPLGTIKDSTLR